MSAVTAPMTLDVSGTARVTFRRLTLVELRKSYDTRASFWLLASIGIIALVIEGFLLIVTLVQDTTAVYEDFVFLAAFGTVILLPLLGIMLVTAEWTQRTAMVTFCLEPNRARVILAKMVAGLLITVASVVVLLLVGVGCMLVYGVLQGPFDWTIALTDVGGLLITQALAMLGGIALATLLLNTPASIVVFFLYRFALPGLFAIMGAFLGWFDELSQWVNFQRAQVPLYDLSISGAEEWGQLISSGFVWLVVPLGLGLLRVSRAEVK